MSNEEKLARIDENQRGLNLHIAIRRRLESEAGKGSLTWKANEMIIREFETRITQLKGEQKGKWLAIDHITFVEVVPETDDKQHGLGDECWCNPKVEQTVGMVKPLISHYSLTESKS